MELAIRKNDATKKGERNEKYALANVLTSFTIENEHVLRNEIVLYYVVDEAPLQICLPSQTKLSILQNTETFNKTYSKNKVYESVEYRVSRMSLFRDAQKYCYDELQRIYLPMFQTWEKCNDMLYYRIIHSLMYHYVVLSCVLPDAAVVLYNTLACHVN